MILKRIVNLLCAKKRLNKLFFILATTTLFCICFVTFTTVGRYPLPMVSRMINNEVYNPASNMALISKHVQLPTNSESKALYHQVRVLCWVLTTPENHLSKARHVKRTWGRRCNKLLFMSSQADTLLGAVKLNVTEGYNQVWNKTQSALRYLYDHHLDDADWFLKADDDTYVIVENLRAFLARKNRMAPVYFGYSYGANHVSGGAGYVFSGQSLRLLIEEGINKLRCTANSTAEDIQISVCFHEVGVDYEDSKDDQGLRLFNPLTPPEALLENYEYYDYEQHPPGTIEEFRCSPHVITFHYITPAQMYALEFFIYHFLLHGGSYPLQNAVAYFI